MRKEARRKIHALAIMLLVVSFLFSWRIWPNLVSDSGFQGNGIALGLPRWDGHDFSIVPRTRIEVPIRQLPEGRFEPIKVPLPRDLDRDFDP